MINIQLTKDDYRRCQSCFKKDTSNSNIYELSFGTDRQTIQIPLCNNCLKELRRKIVIREAKMTPKQRDYISFIEEMTGVQFKDGDNISDYINAHKDEAKRKWELECYARNAEHEDAGDRD